MSRGQDQEKDRAVDLKEPPLQKKNWLGPILAGDWNF